MTVPGVPANFYVQEGNGQVFLSWDLTATATGYSVERSTDGVSFSVIATPSPNYYLDTTVTVGTIYYYKVAGTNGSGTGTYTSAQSIVPARSGVMTLGQVRTLAQQTADLQNNNFITLPEWNSYINQSYFELYDLLVQKYGEEYFMASPYQFLTDGSQFYNLPDGSSSYPVTPGSSTAAAPFYKLKGIDLALNSNINSWVTLHKFDFIARNRYVYPNLTATFMGIVNLRYRIVGNQIEFIPVPQSAQMVQVWYVPRMTQLLQDTDMLDGISGWTEYVVVDAAIKGLMKEESDTSALMARKMALMERIEAAASNRDAGLPDTISDSRRYTDLYGVGSPTGDGPFGGF
jgi:hypothetical protein